MDIPYGLVWNEKLWEKAGNNDNFIVANPSNRHITRIITGAVRVWNIKETEG